MSTISITASRKIKQQLKHTINPTFITTHNYVPNITLKKEVLTMSNNDLKNFLNDSTFSSFYAEFAHTSENDNNHHIQQFNNSPTEKKTSPPTHSIGKVSIKEISTTEPYTNNSQKNINSHEANNIIQRSEFLALQHAITRLQNDLDELKLNMQTQKFHPEITQPPQVNDLLHSQVNHTPSYEKQEQQTAIINNIFAAIEKSRNAMKAYNKSIQNENTSNSTTSLLEQHQDGNLISIEEYKQLHSHPLSSHENYSHELSMYQTRELLEHNLNLLQRSIQALPDETIQEIITENDIQLYHDLFNF